MIQWIVSSSLLILVLIGLRYLLRGRIKPIFQYALWALALVRLLLPVQFGAAPISVENTVENAPLLQEMELAEKVVPAEKVVLVVMQLLAEPDLVDLVEMVELVETADLVDLEVMH